MECERVQEQLSAYYDRELSETDRLAVDTHLASCSSCRDALAGIESLSRLVAESPVPFPESLRRPREDFFEPVPKPAASERRIESRHAWTESVIRNRWWFAAAGILLLLAAVVGDFQPASRNGSTLSQVFLAYATSFPRGSEAAGRLLIERFGARKVSVDDRKALPFTPVVLQHTPKGYTACEAYYVPAQDHPAVVAVLEREDGHRLAVFEQGPAPTGTNRCPCGESCPAEGRCVAHRIDDTLTVCSPCGRRFFTIIGASSEHEAEQLITWFEQRLNESSS
ncbi:MAG: hypothetical protein D6741_17955 [Planctomycetota bacterium]|nr:MAG: hypothetical protein D6741_17955 [Planctomycetota bacterium]